MDLNTRQEGKAIIDEYSDKGYSANYKVEDGKLRDLKTNISFNPNEITIVHSHRLEGTINPSQMDLIYAIKTNDGRKGILLLPDEPESDLNDFIKKVYASMENQNS